MYNDNPTTILYPQTTAQRRGITLPPVSSFPILRSESHFMSGRTSSLEYGSHSPTTDTLISGRSPRRQQNLLYPRTKVRAASVSSFRSKKSAEAGPGLSSRTTPSPKRTRAFGKFGVAAILGPLKTLNFKGLTLNRGGSKHKAMASIQLHDDDMDSGKGLLERPMDIDMDIPISDADIEIDSPTTQFAAYSTPCYDDSDPFATPQPSVANSVDSPLSASSDSRRLRSRLKTLQVLGLEAATAI